MKIGRTRLPTAARMASRGASPSSRMWFSDWWTMRMALLTTVPTRMMKPSMVRTSRGWTDEQVGDREPQEPAERRQGHART